MYGGRPNIMAVQCIRMRYGNAAAAAPKWGITHRLKTENYPRDSCRIIKQFAAYDTAEDPTSDR